MNESEVDTNLSLQLRTEEKRKKTEINYYVCMLKECDICGK